MKAHTFENPNIVSPAQWLAARRELLREEKELSKARDRLAARRLALPWVKVDQPYAFESTNGRVTLGDLFAERSQLLLYHFMLGPGWEEGCKGCAFVADHFDGAIPHLNGHDVSFVAVSSAPLDEILAFKARMGWKFDWVSSNGTSFNRDLGVAFTSEEVEAQKATYNFEVTDPLMEEREGLSAFARDEKGTVYRTYSTYARGLDLLIGAYNLLDLAPKGRNEGADGKMSWVRHHDRYDHVAVAS